MEYESEVMIWAKSEESALAFFGFQGQNRPVRLVQKGPRTEREKEKHSPEANLYAIGEAPRG